MSPDGTLWKSAKPQDSESRGKWWEIYKEPELNDSKKQAEHFEPNHRTVLPELHGGARPGSVGALQLLPYGRPIPSYTTFRKSGQRADSRDNPGTEPARISTLLSRLPGSRMSGAECAIPCGSTQTRHRSAPPISRTSSSLSRRASQNFTLRFAGRIPSLPYINER